ncbi:hypothetical protein ACFPPD_11410 [Cohnella suwonensis]|uniref:Uncharacterized protein n=1 Tax=Cohnella suwonensis TaxID=696072 RepID=A0ABW0LVN2_9BACL
MTSREVKDLKRDVIALVLAVAVIGLVFLVTWVSRTVNDTTPITRIAEAADHLGRFVEDYDSLTPVQLMTADLEPQIYVEAATIAPDEGTANDLRYAAELITKYNDGAGVETLQEAYDILTEVISHFREAAKTT